jgi:hypothetical protein
MSSATWKISFGVSHQVVVQVRSMKINASNSTAAHAINRFASNTVCHGIKTKRAKSTTTERLVGKQRIRPSKRLPVNGKLAELPKNALMSLVPGGYREVMAVIT